MKTFPGWAGRLARKPSRQREERSNEVVARKRAHFAARHMGHHHSQIRDKGRPSPRRDGLLKKRHWTEHPPARKGRKALRVDEKA